MMKDLLIQHGTMITSEKTFLSDIYVSEGKISAIGNNLTFPDSTEIIDASGKYIFPGAIDPHVHFDLPTPAGPSSDNFETGSIAGIFGGTTSFIDFVTPHKKESLITALENRLKDAENSKTDFGFHMSITSWNKNIAKEMEICVKQYGITSFKCYMAYKGVIGIEEEELFEVMKKAASLNALVTVHCEIGDEILRLQKMFLSDGEKSPEFHALSRPSSVETESVKHVTALAQKANCPVYIVHTSAKESVETIANAQQKGQRIFSETCPQYLLLDDSVYILPLPESMKYVISPPMRKEEDQKMLWAGLKNNLIQTVATDHCPFNLKGQKDVGLHNFTRIPNGAGGIEHRLALLYTYGVLQNRISLNQFVALTSTNAAKIFGLYPQKGELAVGSDADITVWDPETENIISSKTHHQNCDSNIFEGFKTKGSAEYVISKGILVLSNGEENSENIKGNYLFRKS
jgi:dihydropyrimidinase